MPFLLYTPVSFLASLFITLPPPSPFPSLPSLFPSSFTFRDYWAVLYLINTSGDWNFICFSEFIYFFSSSLPFFLFLLYSFFSSLLSSSLFPFTLSLLSFFTYLRASLLALQPLATLSTTLLTRKTSVASMCECDKGLRFVTAESLVRRHDLSDSPGRGSDGTGAEGRGGRPFSRGYQKRRHYGF